MIEFITDNTSTISIIITLIVLILAWRKRLLNIGFSRFEKFYKEKTENYETHVKDKINAYELNVLRMCDDNRKLINQYKSDNTRMLKRVTELFEQTNAEVKNQTNVCKMIRNAKEKTTKRDQDWKDNIESELHEVKEDVHYIAGKINGKDSLKSKRNIWKGK